MPVYEYKCTKCGFKFEKFRSIEEDDSIIKCPECGTAEPQRVYSIFDFRRTTCSDVAST